MNQGTSWWRGAIRASCITFLVWLCFIVAAAILGGLSSFYTGRAEELPKWNGWAYLIFSVKEGAMFGALVTWPLALVVFVVCSLHRDDNCK
jgi:hypothetical protein